MNPSSDMECAVVTNPIDFSLSSQSVPFATDEVPPTVLPIRRRHSLGSADALVATAGTPGAGATPRHLCARETQTSGRNQADSGLVHLRMYR